MMSELPSFGNGTRTDFHPSTFPTVSLGRPADPSPRGRAGASGESGGNSGRPPPPPATVASALEAVRGCSSPDPAVRLPAEAALSAWSDAAAGLRAPTAYLPSLAGILAGEPGGDGRPADGGERLLAAIVLKNAIPAVFGAQAALPEDGDGGGGDGPPAVDAETLRRLREETAGVRSALPALLFRESDETVALHLSLAVSNAALFDYPRRWPGLLDDLAAVASGESATPGPAAVTGGKATSRPIPPNQVPRVRAVRTLRYCLRACRNRRVVVKGPGPRGTMANLGDLRGLVARAVAERAEVSRAAAGCLGRLGEGTLSNAAVAVEGCQQLEQWRTQSRLAVGYVRCLAELLPMAADAIGGADDGGEKLRAAAVALLGHLVRICGHGGVRSYPPPNAPAGVDAEEYARMADKLYRASVNCLAAAVRSAPELVAGEVAAALPLVVEPLMTLPPASLHALPAKRLAASTSFARACLVEPLYDARQAGRVDRKNALLALVSGRGRGALAPSPPSPDPAVESARATLTALLAAGTVETLAECIVGKLLRLTAGEVEEWDADPEGRYECDLHVDRGGGGLAELGDGPRQCGCALLQVLVRREPDRVASSLLELTRRVAGGGMLDREACYRALELCHGTMVLGGNRRLDFGEWHSSELAPMLAADLAADTSPVEDRAMQARAVQVVDAYSTSLGEAEFGGAFRSVARLMGAPDLVTALCAARATGHMALMHVRGTDDPPQLASVREHSVFALGLAFDLARRVEGEECLRVTLMAVSSLVEANGVALEPVVRAIAEQLPGLWERAGDSVPIHGCLLSVLQHLIMKMGYSTVENTHVQTVLFPLLDYCTDITQVNRAETLLEDGLRLWLVTLVSSRVSTMGQSLTSMLPRLEQIVRSGLEPQLSLKVLQTNAKLLGPQVVESLAPVLADLLAKLVDPVVRSSSVTSSSPGGGGGDNDEMDDGSGRQAPDAERQDRADRGKETIQGAAAALHFAAFVMRLSPDLGRRIAFPAVAEIARSLPGERFPAPLLEPAFDALGRMLWIEPVCLAELFPNGAADDDGDRKIAAVVGRWIEVSTSVSVLTMMSARAQKITFIEQKGAALSLCAAVFRSPRVARAAGTQVHGYARRVLEAETRSEVDLDSLVEAACSVTRRVVGDGPLGDVSARTADMLASDPLLTMSLKEAVEGAEKAVRALEGGN